LRLFEKQGYEETTIEQIAAAVEISPSTFFNYFPTKEDVVLYDAYDPVAIRMFLERPKDEPLNVGLRKVLEGLAAAFQLRVTARVVTGAMYEATLEWMRSNGRRGLVELFNRALDVVESGARLSTVARTKPRNRRRS
jgi:AcrR family transcriptional regulator